MSALHDAVQNNHIKVAKLLLQKGGESDLLELF